MNVHFLIDAIVRQTTVLIAQLATSGGLRAPLAHVANQVFLDLARELENQGVGRKVSADMFGMALRSYRRKIQRLDESSTDRGRSLWSAVVRFLSEQKVASLAEVLKRFHMDDDTLVRGVLHDLTESGLAFRSGSGWGTLYRLTTDEDLQLLQGQDEDGLDALIWISVYRGGEVSLSDLVGVGGLGRETIQVSLEKLEAVGRVRRAPHEDAEDTWSCEEVVVELGASAGWEAAVFDHFQAVVLTVIGRLQAQPARTGHGDVVGGSTYTLDLWDGHPYRAEVTASLARLREEIGDLRRRVEAYNANHAPARPVEKVTIYFGQHSAIDDADDSINATTHSDEL